MKHLIVPFCLLQPSNELIVCTVFDYFSDICFSYFCFVSTVIVKSDAASKMVKNLVKFTSLIMVTLLSFLSLFLLINHSEQNRCCVQYQQYKPNTGIDTCGHGDREAGASFASRSPSVGFNGMAASSQPLVTQTALKILQKGGSAVDAAIAGAHIY